MKLLVAVKSCERDRMAGYHDAIRETWGKDFPSGVDLRFFMGKSIRTEWGSDAMCKEEIDLPDALDDYDSLPHKTKEILKWSLKQNYKFTFLCDTDTFLIPKILLSCGFQNYDYAGRFGTAVPLGVPFDFLDSRGIMNRNFYIAASGGVGYFLSKRAAEFIVSQEPDFWAEDIWVANVLGPRIAKKEISACDLPEFECSASWHLHKAFIKHGFSIPDMQRESYKLGTPTRFYDLKITELREKMKAAK